MKKTIKTKTVGRNFAEVKEDFVLLEMPMYRVVFRAQIHKGGVRGDVIQQRRASRDDEWVSGKPLKIRNIEKDEVVSVELKTEAVKNLFSAISQLVVILKNNGIEYGEHDYAVFDPKNVVITDENKTEYIKKILSVGDERGIWDILEKLRPDLIKELSYAKIQDHRSKIVDDLGARLKTGKYSETKGEDSWQKWIYKNNWLFGVNYQDPIEKSKINLTGIMPDFLFPTIDGFVDILEIKLPDDEVINHDSSHKGSWKFTSETNAAVAQVINYLSEIDRFRDAIEKEIKKNHRIEVSLLKPRAYILIGNSEKWSNDKKEGLRKINHALHGIEILTYHDLFVRGHQAINLTL